jgi:2-polyprenyl-3-methyl-5-hydroxy-6-metoxy-1,4-benzoquinol methylase
MNWYEEEDLKYSKLYENGYPIGDPFGVVKLFDYKKDISVLDLGCGRATLANYFDGYIGVDVSEYIINLNKEKYPDKIFYHNSIHNLQFLRNNKFDVVICADVMEHLPPNKVSSVLFQIFNLNTNKVALSISTRKSVFLTEDGKNLHLTVWTIEKWLSEIEKLFVVENKVIKNNLLSVELTPIEDKKIVWKRFHQDFELAYHKQTNYRRREELWNEVWDIIYLDFMEFNKDKFDNNDILLDVGCGSRPSLEWFDFGQKNYLDPLLNEYSLIPEMKHYWIDKKMFSVPAEELVPELIGKCSYVQCWNVLDHTFDYIKIIENIIKYLKPGGILLLGTDLDLIPSVGHSGIDNPEKLKSIINSNFNVIKNENRTFKYSREYSIYGIKKEEYKEPKNIKKNKESKDKNIIIVGNGPSILNKENGDKIDSFDIVVRFNWYHIKEYEKYVGTKTNYWFTTIVCPERIKKTYERVYEHSWDFDKDHDKHYKKIVDAGHNTIKTIKDDILEIQKYVGEYSYFTYSTGSIAIWMLLKEHEHIVVTGFDWWEDNKKHHYGDGHKIGTIHKPDKEYVFIKKLIDDNKISFL